ncbi:MAG: hypothetical protein NTW21_26110 [Verrucomicrobia bacterium]|nr:hypothetical protein [Verrucomicrobiota bacterium]
MLPGIFELPPKRQPASLCWAGAWPVSPGKTFTRRLVGVTVPDLGADVVLERHCGPMLLELKARPGPGIRLANRAPLLPRLRLIETPTRLAQTKTR